MGDGSLADFVIESGKLAPVLGRELIRKVGRELIVKKGPSDHVAAKRFVYDQRARSVVNKLAEIPFDEFVAQFGRIILPFDKMWIEETFDPETENKPGTIQRKGFLIRKSDDGIRVRHVLEFLVVDSQRMPRAKACKTLQSLGIYVREDGHYIQTSDFDAVISEKGIDIDDSASSYSALAKLLTAQKKEESSEMQCAKAMARLLVLISCRNIKTNLLPGIPDPQLNEHPCDPNRPIRIDLSDDLEQALRERDDKIVRQLLGWTDVMRHKRTYHTVDGPVEKIIEPYDRRIKAPVDRRGTKRILTSTTPNLSIDFQPDRPPTLINTKNHPNKKL